MIEIRSFGLNEISESSVSESRSFDPDKRIDVNQRQDVKRSDEYDPDKRINVDAVEKHYYDDNGNPYRINDDLIPSNKYEINGYKYATDIQGRIDSAEGTLHMKAHEGRLTIKDSIEDIGKGDQKEGDDRGHLIGDQFDGSNGLENMIPQDANINQRDFRYFENELAKCVKEEKEVTIMVEPVYEDDSRRPIAVIVTYSIDGEESVKMFPNETEGK